MSKRTIRRNRQWLKRLWQEHEKRFSKPFRETGIKAWLESIVKISDIEQSLRMK